jgi:uncharacterized membrane protein YagU involved in acid resistance
LPLNEQASEFLGHALWGFVIGVCYEDLRRRLTRPALHAIRASG